MLGNHFGAWCTRAAARATALFVTINGLAAVQAQAGEQADRAVAAVRQLVASGAVKPDTVLRLRAKQGNLVSLLGRDFQLQREWERQTGIPIDASVMPQLDSLDFIRDGRDIDLTIARTHEYADLDAAGLVEDLRPMLQRFGFTLPDRGANGYMLLAPQSRHGERLVAVPADLDIAMLFLRADLLRDENERRRFRERFGAELEPPRTWADYERLIGFFHRPEQGLYGAGEPRERLTAWMYWTPRFLSQAPGQALFDARMRPLIDSAAGIAATESYIATVRHSPPKVLEDGNDFNYTLPLFVRGQLFSTILTSATAKIANRENSAVRGKGSRIKRTGGIASGPIELMKAVNELGRSVMQGGNRRSAIWAGLKWSHPDVFDFIHLKDWPEYIRAAKEKDFNAVAPMDMTNISVLLDDEFFAAYHDEAHE